MTSKQQDAPRVVDLFCGCGGLSAGLRDAGFKVVAGADNETKYMSTFEVNFPDALHVKADLSLYPPDELLRTLGIKQGELELLAGGPPCQGFSKNVPRSRRSADSSNNLLIFRFIEFCEVIRPKAVMMENVAEMKNGFSHQFTDEIATRLANAGYTVASVVINAAEFGVPQMRKRAFVFAALSGNRLTPPDRTHKAPSEQMGFSSTPDYVNVWDAIGDLPSIRHGEGSAETEYACPPFSDYQRMVRSIDGTVKNHLARRLQPKQYARISSLEPGQGLNDLPNSLKVRAGYSGAYGRLTKDMVAPTITRWMFHPGSGRWGHPIDLRTLTIREAARLQGFHDDYEFVGSFVQQAGQIGNAVPPLLATALGRSVLRQLFI